MLRSLVGSEMCIRDRVSTQSTGDQSPSTMLTIAPAATVLLLFLVAMASAAPALVYELSPVSDPAQLEGSHPHVIFAVSLPDSINECVTISTRETPLEADGVETLAKYFQVYDSPGGCDGEQGDILRYLGLDVKRQETESAEEWIQLCGGQTMRVEVQLAYEWKHDGVYTVRLLRDPEVCTSFEIQGSAEFMVGLEAKQEDAKMLVKKERASFNAASFTYDSSCTASHVTALTLSLIHI
eukprot:TRINITY_DN11025_c0_g2_i8.p1 TRINITY_DN11025_c0_g2~~TRINITY_DN11025_c0_g2_i8.p1  ORF type:complete len:239 (-),score=63.17 TRINITY_DN11025_c0_g2_i8:140-856(-)